MIILIVAFDQITKYFAEKNLADGKIVSFLPGFVQFRYAQNTGMAFSMLSGARWIFVVITIIVCGGVMWFLFSNRAKNLWVYWSLGVVLAGGVGNLIDRARFGYVVNFAVFNIADCAVTCGAAVLVVYLLIDAFKKDKRDGDE